MIWPTRRTTVTAVLGAATLGLAAYLLWPRQPLSSPQVARPPAFESLVPAPDFKPGPKVIFKWQDAAGDWHFGDSPPAEGIPRELSLSSPYRPAGSAPSNTSQPSVQPDS